MYLLEIRHCVQSGEFIYQNSLTIKVGSRYMCFVHIWWTLYVKEKQCLWTWPLSQPVQRRSCCPLLVLCGTAPPDTAGCSQAWCQCGWFCTECEGSPDPAEPIEKTQSSYPDVSFHVTSAYDSIRAGLVPQTDQDDRQHKTVACLMYSAASGFY